MNFRWLITYDIFSGATPDTRAWRPVKVTRNTEQNTNDWASYYRSQNIEIRNLKVQRVSVNA